MDWDSIDVVMLDLDGTLLDLHHDNQLWKSHLVDRYAAARDIPVDAARSEIFAQMDTVHGTLDWYCLDYWSQQLGLDMRALSRDVDHLIRLHAHAEPFLEAVSGWKRVVLVTNAHRDVLELKMEKTRIEPYFERIVSAHDYRVPKEDAAFWLKLAGDLDFQPARTLLVDDNLAVLRTARRHGIGHLLAISRPDSREPARTVEEFPAVPDFEPILSGLAAVGRPRHGTRFLGTSNPRSAGRS
jgi:putative hydrolase of the HAD superfamily